MARKRKRQQRRGGSKKNSAQGNPWSRVSDSETQAIESGEPGLTGCRQGQMSDQPGKLMPGAQSKENAKDSPEQAWECGRREAMP